MLNKKIGLVLLAALLVSCSDKKEEETLTDPNQLFGEASSLLAADEYEKSAEKFAKIEREHPTSELATEAQVKRAYAKYLDGKFDDAVFIIDEFVKQYPTHQVTPYMYYLRGLCYYDQILDVGRDQELSNKAIKAFGELIARFPDSKYSKDAQLKIEYAENLLAGKEMEIGRFYLQKKEMIAALGRFRVVVDQYQNSIFISEALYRLTEIYYTLGDTEQAQRYASVLGYNYPDSEWYEMAYSLLQGVDVQKKQDPWYKKAINNIW